MQPCFCTDVLAAAPFFLGADPRDRKDLCAVQPVLCLEYLIFISHSISSLISQNLSVLYENSQRHRTVILLLQVVCHGPMASVFAPGSAG